MILGGRIAQRLPLFTQSFCYSAIRLSAVINSSEVLYRPIMFYVEVCSGSFSLLQHLQIMQCSRIGQDCEAVVCNYLFVSRLQVILTTRLKIPRARERYGEKKKSETFALVL